MRFFNVIRFALCLMCFGTLNVTQACSYPVQYIEEEHKSLKKSFQHAYESGWQNLGNRVVIGRYEVDEAGVYFRVTRVREGVKEPMDWQPKLKKYRLYSGTVYREDDRKPRVTCSRVEYIQRVPPHQSFQTILDKEYVVVLYPIRGRWLQQIVGVGIEKMQSRTSSISYQMPLVDPMPKSLGTAEVYPKADFLKKFGFK